MGEAEQTPTLKYQTPDPRPRPRPRPFWSVFFAACVTSFFLTDGAITWMRGRPSRDGGVWFLEALGVLAMTVLVCFIGGGAPSKRGFSSWLPATLGILAPPMGLVICSLFRWG